MYKDRKIFLLLVILFYCVFVPFLSAENGSKLIKIKENIRIPKKEYLRYANYTGGVLSEYTHMFFTTYKKDDGTLMLKMFIKDNDVNTPLKFKRLRTMKDFTEVYIYDLTHLRPVEYHWNREEENRTRGIKGYNRGHDWLDTETGYYISIWKGWNGYEEISRKIRVKVPPNVPVFDIFTIGYIGVRFGDIRKGGYGYFIFPGFKNALRGYAKIVGKERVNTRIGSFNTLKVRFGLTNFFLNILLGRQLSMYSFLVDEKKNLIIKKEQGKYVDVIDDVSEFNNLEKKIKEVDKWIINEDNKQHKEAEK